MHKPKNIHPNRCLRHCRIGLSPPSVKRRSSSELSAISQSSPRQPLKTAVPKSVYKRLKRRDPRDRISGPPLASARRNRLRPARKLFTVTAYTAVRSIGTPSFRLKDQTLCIIKKPGAIRLLGSLRVSCVLHEVSKIPENYNSLSQQAAGRQNRDIKTHLS